MIETQRTILKERTSEDIQRLIDLPEKEARLLINLPETAEMEPVRESARRTLQFLPKNWIIWNIVHKKTNRIMGDCLYHNCVPHHHRGEIGYRLYPEFHRNGYMTEIVPQLLEYGFVQLNLHRIEAMTAHDNEGSMKLLVRNGFVKEGVLRENYIVNGIPSDSLMFSLLKSEYNPKL